jgi:hypothetical protein
VGFRQRAEIGRHQHRIQWQGIGIDFLAAAPIGEVRVDSAIASSA